MVKTTRIRTKPNRESSIMFCISIDFLLGTIGSRAYPNRTKNGSYAVSETKSNLKFWFGSVIRFELCHWNFWWFKIVVFKAHFYKALLVVSLNGSYVSHAHARRTLAMKWEWYQIPKFLHEFVLCKSEKK